MTGQKETKKVAVDVRITLFIRLTQLCMYVGLHHID
jgi:hypothetical protein